MHLTNTCRVLLYSRPFAYVWGFKGRQVVILAYLEVSGLCGGINTTTITITIHQVLQLLNG
jgi:hypothetical protein